MTNIIMYTCHSCTFIWHINHHDDETNTHSIIAFHMDFWFRWGLRDCPNYHRIRLTTTFYYQIPGSQHGWLSSSWCCISLKLWTVSWIVQCWGLNHLMVASVHQSYHQVHQWLTLACCRVNHAMTMMRAKSRESGKYRRHQDSYLKVEKWINT